MDYQSNYQSGAMTEPEFQRLSQTIGTNIQKILQNVSSMQRMIAQIGTPQVGTEEEPGAPAVGAVFTAPFAFPGQPAVPAAAAPDPALHGPAGQGHVQAPARHELRILFCLWRRAEAVEAAEGEAAQRLHKGAEQLPGQGTKKR